MFAHKIIFAFFSVKDGRKHGKTFLEVVTAEYTNLMKHSWKQGTACR
jgi:hypothetical protein